MRRYHESAHARRGDDHPVPQHPELTVRSQGGGAEVRDKRREFKIKPGGGASNLVESGEAF